MKKALATLAILATFVSVAGAASIRNSKHDMSSTSTTTGPKSTNLNDICVFCHTPHESMIQGAAPAPAVYPLWNHNLSSATYTVYTSVTMNATVGALSSGFTVTNLCMGCHDGTIGLGTLYNDPNIINADPTMSAAITGGALLGTDLRNDHPVNFTYDAALALADGGLNTPNATINSWLVGGTVQCSSCHDVHDPANVPFLRISNAASALCLTCHNK